MTTVLAELELDQVSCAAVLTQLAESKGLSRRTAQRTVQQAYALIREDIDQCNVERTDLVAQAIHLLMESDVAEMSEEKRERINAEIKAELSDYAEHLLKEHK